MPAPDPTIDALLRQAMAEKRLVSFTMDGVPRLGEPHDYGIYKGVLRLFYFQLRGRSGVPPAWRWADLAKISGLEVRDDRFHGTRPAPSGTHVKWDRLLASVSDRVVDAVPVGKRR